jgi:hypothetical protein
MEYVDPKAELRKLMQEVGGKESIVDKITRLSATYPDLKLVPEGTDYLFCSNSAVEGTDNYGYSSHKVSGDTFTLVWPYRNIEGTMIRSDPPYIRVARENTLGFGLQQLPGWEDELNKLGMSAKATTAIRYFLNGKPAINYMD